MPTPVRRFPRQRRASASVCVPCAFSVWDGRRASWVLPVCTPVQNLELSLGFIAVWRDLVGGRGRDPGLAGVQRRTTSYYAYLPVSRALFGERLVLHENTGWLRPDRVQRDGRYGGTLRTGRGGAGFTLGLALITPPFL